MGINKTSEFLTKKPQGFLITGIGASAGGIQALKEFFQQVPDNSHVAYVVILHLSPDHDSKLVEILQSVTNIPVTQVTEKIKIEPDHIYVVPPNQHLIMEDNFIAPSVNLYMEERRAPVDIFFRTLADSHGPRAICVVLSGTGANGSMGLKRVKELGGVAYVQNPREAEFNEMPRNAIATGLVDEVLPVAEIPDKIMAYRDRVGKIEIPMEAEERPEQQQQALRKIFTQLRIRTGHDFSNYKRPTMLRRIERRINLRNQPDLPNYANFVQQNVDEANALLKDLLISVTNFFRDKKAFEAVEQDVLPAIFKNKTAHDEVRIWVAGCATGEEAYSMAMLVAERTFGALDMPKVQIFATDIDEAALTAAREGLYTLNDAADVSPERLRNFFQKEGENYRVKREIREMILFASHNFLKDPPFSRLDLVTCRNVLIYLNVPAQERVMETFHFALKSGGYLFLGLSESVDGASDLYAVVNREHHIFQAREIALRHYPVPESVPTFHTRHHPPVKLTDSESWPNNRVSFGELHQKLLEQYAPPSLVVNEDYDILHISEKAGSYLEFSGGEPTKNLLKLIKPELRLELRSALYQAVQRQVPMETRNIPFIVNGERQSVNIQVRPVSKEGDTAKGFILVLFEQNTKEPDTETIVLSSDEPVAKQLEQELILIKSQLKRSIDQHEYQEEELKASNEELQAMNEELRSAAEELETSKEELQSINEELRTVNQELKVKIEETTVTRNNLQNLINSAEVATIFLDRAFCTRLYTLATLKIFNLIPSDYGRPISDITHRLEYKDLLRDAETVLEKLTTLEREVTTTDGQVFMMRVLPYRTKEDRINGVVITFFDVTERKKTEEKQAFLLKLSDVLRPLADPLEIQGAAARLVGEYLESDRAYYVELNDVAHEFVVASDWHQPGSPSHARRYSLGDWAMPWLINGQTWVVRDTTSDPAMPDDQREAYLGNDIGAAVVVPLLKQGRLVATFVTNQRAPRNWTSHEIAIVEETAERTWAAVERALAEEALQQTNVQIIDILESTTDAFYALDASFNFTYINKKAAQLWNRDSASLIGKNIWTEFPEIIKNLSYQKHYKVLKEGKAVHFETLSPRVGTWIEVSIHPSNTGGLSVFFREITERKIAEERQAYLLQLSEALRPVEDLEEVQLAAVGLLGKHLGVARAFYGEVEADNDQIWIHRNYTNGVESQTGKFRMSDFGPFLLKEYLAGKTVVMLDTETDTRLTKEERALFASLNVRAFVGVPLVKGDQIFKVLAVNQPTPRQWTEAELSIIEETAHRTSAAVERAKAEENLRQSKRLQKVLSIDTVGVIYFDLEGSILDANAAFERMSGYAVEELTSRKVSWKDLTPPEFTEVSKQALKEFKEKGQNTAYEKQYFRSDGSRWWGLFAGKRLSENEYVEFVLDITEQKAAEEKLKQFNELLEQQVAERTQALQASRDMLQSVFDTTLLSLSILKAVRNKKGEITDFKLELVNKELERETGRTDLVGKLYSVEFPGIKQAGLFDIMLRVMETGEPEQIEYYYPHENFNKWFSAMFVKLDDGLVASNLDITERKQAEAELTRNFSILKQAEEVAGMGCWEFDYTTGSFYWSEGMDHLFGLPLGSSPLPETYLEYVIEEDRPKAEKLVQTIRNNPQPIEETLRIRVNYELKTLKIKSAVLHDDLARPYKLLGVDLDVSELKRLEEENIQMRLEQQKSLLLAILEAQEEERKRISESLHNGVGQILYATKLNLDQLAKQIPKEVITPTAKLLSEAIQETRRVSHELVPMVLQDFGLAQAMQELCQKYNPGSIELNCDVDLPEPLEAYLELALYRISQELLTNVVKHAQATKADLLLTQEEGEIILKVRDNGKGIDLDLERSLSKGLGLRTITDQVKLLNGTFTLSKPPSGKGTLVVIHLPVSG